MNQQRYPFLRQARFWIAIICVVIVSSSAGCFFLWTLDIITQANGSHPWLIFFLPIIGVAVHRLYQWDALHTKEDEWACDYGAKALGQVLRGDHRKIKVWMAPLIYIGTISTHLFGGSAGRAGSALIIGGGIASCFYKRFFEPEAKQILIGCGMAACFAAVLGTPLAAAMLCYEIARKKSPFSLCIILYVIAAYLSDGIAHVIGIARTDFSLLLPPRSNAAWLSARWWLSALMLGLSCAVVANAYQFFVEKWKAILQKSVKRAWARPFVGGLVLIFLYCAIGTPDYLGLGLDPRHPTGISITSAFHQNGAHWWSWLAKLLFTVITLGSGFKGGEVTPLFFMGATLGNFIAALTNAPIADFAAAGMMAIFAAASRCPAACILMGGELFGWCQMPFVALICLISYCFARKNGLFENN